MGNELAPTNPGLTYDPRLGSTARFFAALQKELSKQSKMKGGKPYTIGNPKPVPDPGPAAILAMPNPRYAGKVFGR